jgi:DNA-binding CsgD family transcriptional regulator
MIEDQGHHGRATARLLESKGYRVWSLPGSEALLCAPLRKGATDRGRSGIEMLRAFLDHGSAPARPADADARALLDGLTVRQRQVLTGIVRGSANKVIAWELGLSVRTVEAYRMQLFRRLHARNTAEAIRIALTAGFAGDAGEGHGPESFSLLPL